MATAISCSSEMIAESHSSTPLKANPTAQTAQPLTSDTTPNPTTTTEQKSLTRWIEINLSDQQLYGWEGENLAYSFEISTGKKSTPTPTGKFLISTKYRYNRMRGSDYDIPDVPYAMYFYKGYAIHGAYWHNRFGTPVSHGCINLRVKDARKLYHWSSIGTLVVVHE